MALKSAIRVASRAFLIYPVYAESQAVARIAMIAITTISSIRVKPDCLREVQERDIGQIKEKIPWGGLLCY